MSAAQQTTLVETLPFLKGWTPVITLLVAFIVAKLKPSNAVSTQTQQLLDEIARLRLNVFLRSAGSAELPTPTPTPVAVPTILPVAVPTQPVAESVVEQEPVTRVDIALPKIDPPAPVPIDTRLLVSLMLEYLQQTKPPIVKAHNRE